MFANSLNIINQQSQTFTNIYTSLHNCTQVYTTVLQAKTMHKFTTVLKFYKHNTITTCQTSFYKPNNLNTLFSKTSQNFGKFNKTSHHFTKLYTTLRYIHLQTFTKLYKALKLYKIPNEFSTLYDMYNKNATLNTPRGPLQTLGATL